MKCRFARERVLKCWTIGGLNFFFLPLANSDRIRKCCAGGELRKYIGVHRSEIIATRYQEVISYRKLFNELTL